MYKLAPVTFNNGQRPSKRSIAVSGTWAQDSQWTKDSGYIFDVTAQVAAVSRLSGRSNTSPIVIVFHGTGGQWARKFIYGTGGSAPRLVVKYTTAN